MTEDQPTCGKGLAWNAILPATMADVLASLGAVLAAHRNALDLTDERSRQEDAAYSRLVQACGAIADSLRKTATTMEACRDLPMGRHEMDVMTSAEPVAAFETFVKRQQALLGLLQGRLPEDQEMLGQMKRMSRPS